MKKIALIVILAIVAPILYIIVMNYNNVPKLDESVKEKWSQVQNQYKRRADLIPNLVATVKGYAEHEKETLEGVINARAQATKTTIDPTNLTVENMAQFQQAQQGLSGALSRLLVTVERYPDLKADKSFLELQSQLEGTENRINVERNRYNDVVNVYDKHIKEFPGMLLAGLFGFDEMPRYKSAPGSENAPKVEF